MIFTLMLLLLVVRFEVLFGTNEGTIVSITDFYSCDRLGNPQDYFPIKTTAYFNITVSNFTHDPKNISMHLTILDELNVPVSFEELNTATPPDASTHYIMSSFIPKWAHVGVATAHVSMSIEGSPTDSENTSFYIGPEDLTSPVIHLLSPENVTYEMESVPLVFRADERFPFWIGYSLNNLENVSIAGNTTLTGLANDSYNIIVYANDTSGNVGSSEKIYFTIFIIREIAVTNITSSKNLIGQGYSIPINVTVRNQGDYTENFNVTAYANTTVIQTKTITLTSENSTHIIFTWNTTGFAKGNYTISAYAWPVPGEIDTSNNVLRDGWIAVTVPGDINGDFIVNYFDAILLGAAFGSQPGDSNWNPNANINSDNVINFLDAIITSSNFGKTGT